MELAAARHRVVAVLCNDAVIDQLDVERSKPRDKHLCSANVLARRTSLTVRMVMREHNPAALHITALRGMATGSRSTLEVLPRLWSSQRISRQLLST